VGFKPVPSTFKLPAKSTSTILSEASIAAATTTVFANCTAVNLSSGKWTVALTIAVTYNALATRGIRVHPRSSYDNSNYDTEDWTTFWDPQFTAGATIRETLIYYTDVNYIKVLVENLDPIQTVTNVKVTATIG